METGVHRLVTCSSLYMESGVLGLVPVCRQESLLKQLQERGILCRFNLNLLRIPWIQLINRPDLTKSRILGHFWIKVVLTTQGPSLRSFSIVASVMWSEYLGIYYCLWLQQAPKHLLFVSILSLKNSWSLLSPFKTYTLNFSLPRSTHSPTLLPSHKLSATLWLLSLYSLNFHSFC